MVEHVPLNVQQTIAGQGADWHATKPRVVEPGGQNSVVARTKQEPEVESQQAREGHGEGAWHVTPTCKEVPPGQLPAGPIDQQASEVGLQQAREGQM